MASDQYLKGHRISRHLSPGFDSLRYQEALLMGLIPKQDLVDGAVYRGYCRNAEFATWHADEGVFIYTRIKFDSEFEEEIHHPEDDDGHDIFIPIERSTEV